MINLRHYQKLVVDGIRDLFIKGFNDILAVLPTGGGKTVVFTFMAHAMSLRDKKSIILVHRVELLRQTSIALSKFDVEHGMINPQYTPNFKNNVQIASVQTIIKRLNYFAAINWIPDVIIIDETHHVNSKSWLKIINHFKELNPSLKIIGVTATPIRGDGQGLGICSGGIFEEMVVGPQMSELIEEGFLVRPKIFGPPKKLDLSEIKTQMGDYDKKSLSRLVDKPKITGDAVDHYRELCPGVPTIVFCVSVAHAEHVAEQFRKGGYKFYSIDGSMSDEDRKNLINGLVNGTIEGLVSCDLISEGTDIPRATASIELRPTKSKGLNLQQRGRVLRPVYASGYDLETKEGRLASISASEKPYAIILDHVGNTDEHGLPYDFQDWTLEGTKRKKGSKKKEEEAVKVVMCESCFMHQEPTSVCIGCGHVMKPPKDITPKQVEGRLQEITSESLKAKKEAAAPKTSSLEYLLKVAKQRGYKPEWAHHMDLAQQKKIEKLSKLTNIEGILSDIEKPEFHDDLNF